MERLKSQNMKGIEHKVKYIFCIVANTYIHTYDVYLLDNKFGIHSKANNRQGVIFIFKSIFII